MHILSELRNPLFDTPDRQRALRALQMSRLLKENNNTKAWTVVKSMIDKVIGEQFVTQQQRTSSSSSSSSYVTPPMATMNNPAAGGGVLPEYVDRIPSYAYQTHRTPDPFGATSTVQSNTVQSRPVQPPTSLGLDDANMQPFNWDEINLNNIVGNTPMPQNPELPEFDWVSAFRPKFCSSY
jgi:hypothetical protein